jgi:predicted HTH domain antitoxin
MASTIDLSPAVEAQLRAGIVDLDAAAKLGLAVEAYRSGNLTLGQFAELLGVSQYEADGILKERGVVLDLDAEQLAEERETLARLLGS